MDAEAVASFLDCVAVENLSEETAMLAWVDRVLAEINEEAF